MVELKIRAHKVILAAVLSLGVGVGCTDEPVDGSPRGATSSPVPQDDEYSLKVYLGNEEHGQLVKFGPMDVAPSAHRASLEDVSEFDAKLAEEGVPLREQAVVDDENDPEGTYDTIVRDLEDGYAPGWTLASLAAKTCSTGYNGVAGRPWVGVLKFPWEIESPLTVHLLTMSDVKCDGLLAVEEVMLCTADRLAEIADSPGTVYWDSVYKKDLNGTETEPIKVTIPPQATQDRFIARDMALNILAALGQTMLRNANDLNADESCLQKYLDFAENPISDNSATMQLGIFSEWFRADGQDADHNTLRSDIQELEGSSWVIKPADELVEPTLARVALKVNIMAAAARLTKQLIEDSVNDDLAGAERVRSRSGDPVEGAKRMWGVLDSTNPSKTQYYDSLRHAMKVLFGRLELSPNRDGTFAKGPTPLWSSQGLMLDDPACRTYLASQVIDALGAGHSARWNDIAPTSSSQASAMNLLERSGIVIPPVDGRIDLDRDAIIDQLLTIGAEAAGETLSTFDVAGNLLAKAIRQGLTSSKISDADLEFALKRNFDAFRLLTEYPEVGDGSILTQRPLTTAAADNGLALRTTVNAITAQGGIVIDNGIPRYELSGNIMPKLAGASAASQCAVERAAGGSGASSEDEVLSFTRGWVDSHQNPFALAQVFQRQLGVIRDALDGTDPSDIRAFANNAVAEIDQWAGPGRVVAQPGHVASNSAAAVINDNDHVYITGMTLEELGVTSPDQLKKVLVRVDATNPMYTECLVGQRETCPTIPDDADPAIFQAPLTVALDTNSGAYMAGLNDPVLVVTFPHITKFARSDFEVGTPISPTSDYFDALDAMPPVVNLAIRADDEVNGGVGRFLASVRTDVRPALGESTTAVISSLQTALANEVFGLASVDRSQRSCRGGGLSSALTKNYCELGIARNQFVPLANELTSEGTGFEDSWRHYLRIAKEAANKADQIGRELIDLGIQRDIRQEAALEEVANLCGSFPSIDGIGAEDGLLEPESDDDATNDCVDDETIDLVFVGEDPFAFDSGAQAVQDQDLAIRGLYCPSQWVYLPELDITEAPDTSLFPDSSFCQKKPRSACETDPVNCITHAGLGYVDTAVLPERAPASEVCGDLIRAKQWSELTGTTYDSTALMTAVSGKAWSTNAGLKTAIRSYHLQENTNGDWGIFLDDQPVVANLGMVSGLGTVDDIYPACREQNGFSSCTETALEAARLLLRSDDQLSIADSETLRALAEDAVHGLAALAGELPAGAITMPMPVANLTELNTEIQSGTEGVFVPAWAIYGPSEFVEQAGQYELDPRFLNTGSMGLTGGNGMQLHQYDVSSLRGLGPMTTPYLTRRDSAAIYGDGLAQDFADVAAHQGGYLLLLASNGAFTYQEDLANQTGVVPLEDLGSAAPALTRQDMANWYVLFAQDFSKDDTTAPIGDSAAAGRERIAPLFNPTPSQQTGPSESQGGVCPQDYGGPAFVLSYGKPDANGGTVTALGQYLPRVDLVQDASPFVSLEATPGYPDDFGWEAYHFILGRYPFPMSATVNGGLVKDRTNSYYFTGLNALFPLENNETWNLGSSIFQQLGFSFSVLQGTNPYQSQPFAGLDFSVSATGTWTNMRPEGYYRLSPKKCGAHQRVELMLPPPRVDTVLRGLGMACYASVGGLAPEIYAPPATIQRVEDIKELESWMALVAHASSTIGGMLVLNEVPRSVVDSLREQTVDATNVGQGTAGQLKLELGQSLRTVKSAFVELAIQFDKLRGKMRAARIRIERTGIEQRAARLATERDTLEMNRQQYVDSTERAMRAMQRDYGMISAGVTMAAATAEAGQTLVDAVNPYSARRGSLAGVYTQLGIAVNAGFEMAKLREEGVFDRRIGRYNDEFYSNLAGVIAAQQQVDEDRAANDLQATLTDLSLDVQDTYSGINNAMTAIQNGTSDALQSLNQLVLNRQAAVTALGKAAGADFVEQNGELVPLHLNTVYRRQFGVLKKRYERALSSALRAAYVARLAIEQRLGVRFEHIHEDVGPLPPPSTWINDLCSLQGIDYSALREASDPTADPNAEVDLIAGFANEYVGDYVDKLEELVEFFNIQSPFKESDDTAILSLRELLGKTGQSCSKPSRNLLFYSDHLETPALASPLHLAKQGWRISGCDDQSCLKVDPGVMLANAPGDDFEPPLGSGAATWLHSVAPDATAGLVLPNATQVGAPPNTVYQSVRLEEGERYTLSWWDMLRDAIGEPSATEPTPYRVAVYSDEWEPIATFSDLPQESGDGTEWSGRRRLEFIAFDSGNYHVAFTPSLPGDPAQSIAIANVQLERQSANIDLVGYQSNSGSLIVASGDCGADDPEAFRARFTYECAPGGCYYELNDVLNIDTELLDQGRSPLVGQIALGNFNYRHVTLAANIVGTGVLDCTDSDLASCYGSGFVEYDLVHRAHDIPLLDYDGDATCFDFRSAAIRSGKALSTERFLTLPLSSADRELISQNAIQQSQLAGRPLSGSYRLRIRDTPALAWEGVEDVQLLVDYRYWSRVE